MKHKKYFVYIVLVFLTSIAFGKKFSDPPAGQGLSTVGISGDYTSLREASEDFSGLVGGCTGNWTLEILNDLIDHIIVLLEILSGAIPLPSNQLPEFDLL
jgi:hypothetical protein